MCKNILRVRVCVCYRLALMNEETGINIQNLGDIRWHLCLCLVLAWILVILFVSRGIQSTGKVILPNNSVFLSIM